MKKFGGRSKVAPPQQSATPMHQMAMAAAAPVVQEVTLGSTMQATMMVDKSLKTPFDLGDWNALLELKWSNGSPVADVTTLPGRQLLYQLYSIITMPKNKHHIIKDSLKDAKSTLEQIVARLVPVFAKLTQQDTVYAILQTFIYDPELYLYNAEIDQLRTINNVAEGEQCPRCGCYKTITYYIQDRSGDEGESRKFKCLMCPEGSKT